MIVDAFHTVKKNGKYIQRKKVRWVIFENINHKCMRTMMTILIYARNGKYRNMSVRSKEEKPQKKTHNLHENKRYFVSPSAFILHYTTYAKLYKRTFCKDCVRF